MTIAALDQGTSSTRCLLIGGAGPEGTVQKDAVQKDVVQKGCVQGVAQYRHRQIRPAPGRAEHDPAEVLAALRRCMEDALGTAARQGEAITGWALANQGETCLAWDSRTGAPLSPFITWQDSRTAAALAARPAADHALSRRISGLPLDPYFSASKLAWMLQELPQVAAALEQGHLSLGTSDAWLIGQLTGHYVTDHSTASRTGLYDIARGCWSPELCALHGLPEAALPEIRDSDADFGTVADIPLRAALTDQQAALLGHGCTSPGRMKITFGTGAFLLAHAGATPPVSEAGLLPTVAWSQDGTRSFALEGGVYDVGAALDWARDAGLFSDWSDLADMPGETALSEGIVVLPAFSGLAAPDWDRFAAPLMIGFGMGTAPLRLAQAMLEGIALMTARLVTAVSGDLDRAGLTRPQAISVDGGVARSDHFLRLLAAATGLPVERPGEIEATALGLAALAEGSTPAPVRPPDRFLPEPLFSEADHQRFSRALALCSGWHLPGK